MCDYYVYYLEEENMFVEEDGTIIFDLFDIITPRDLFLFRHDQDKFDTFPLVKHREITVHVDVIPSGDICGLKYMGVLDLGDYYDRWELYERTKMANVTG